MKDWDELPDRSEAPLREFLDLCEEHRVECTFFFVGWYGRRYPKRVQEVVRRGHEVGCHSLYHEDVARLDPGQFLAATKDALAMLEDAGGVQVQSYRAPSFSIPVTRCVEFFGALSELGFKIDSSVCTAGRIYGGGFDPAEFLGPANLREMYGMDLFEVPVPGVRIAGRSVQLFGGGYLRLAPAALVRKFAATERYQVLYLHPHDLDKNVPEIPGAGWTMNLRRRLGWGDLREKLRFLFATSTVKSCRQLLATQSGV
jgi:polysaccharide deacetylase family protein (PEP-CTERM system associated)